jgi:hypothetical protein
MFICCTILILLVSLSMSIIFVVPIKDIISSNLSSDEQIRHFFENKLPEIVVNNIVFDFSGVEFMNYSSALQYINCKFKSKSKILREINMPDNLKSLLESALYEVEQFGQNKINKKIESILIRNLSKQDTK